jgi:ribosome maturation factor RimP
LEFDGQQLKIEMKIKTRKKTIEIPYEKVANARLAVTFS